MRLTPPIRMTLEKALAYIEDDELVEVTPKSIRLRKKLLDQTERKREDRAPHRRSGVTRGHSAESVSNHFANQSARRRCLITARTGARVARRPVW